MDALTLEMDNDELADLYHIIDNFLSYSNHPDWRMFLREWMEMMGSVYGKHDKHRLVFNKEDIKILLTVMRYDTRRRLSSSKEDMRRTILQWIAIKD